MPINTSVDLRPTPTASLMPPPSEGPAHATYLVSDAGTKRLAQRLEPGAHPRLLKYLLTRQVRPATTAWAPNKPPLDAQQVPKAAKIEEVSKLFTPKKQTNKIILLTLNAFANKEPSTFAFRQFCERPALAELSSSRSPLDHVPDPELRAAKQQHLATQPLPKQDAIPPQKVAQRARIVKPATQSNTPLPLQSPKPTGSPHAETVHNNKASNDEAACPAPTREQIAQATQRIDDTRRNMLERMMVSLKGICLNVKDSASKNIYEQLTKLAAYVTKVNVYGDKSTRDAAKELLHQEINPGCSLTEWDNAGGPERKQRAESINNLEHLLAPLQKLIKKLESATGRNTPA